MAAFAIFMLHSAPSLLEGPGHFYMPSKCEVESVCIDSATAHLALSLGLLTIHMNVYSIPLKECKVNRSLGIFLNDTLHKIGKLQ